MWGQVQTQYFFSLTPDQVMDAVESALVSQNLKCTGRCLTLGSYENRVYDLELEDQDAHVSRVIAKFYRPGRWTREQILEEHAFLKELKEDEITVIAPLEFEGQTLFLAQNIYFSLFPKVGGRSPEEFTPDQAQWLGRLIARIHLVGLRKNYQHRLTLNPTTYGREALKTVASVVPLTYRQRYLSLGEEICQKSDELWSRLDSGSMIRLHGDCHIGNLLWGPQGPFFLDFDDSVMGPAIQDLWLLLSSQDREEMKRSLKDFIRGYEEFRDFDDSQIRLIEPLRALRFMHYTGWIAKRWEDPAFPKAFPNFGTDSYWREMTDDLAEQLRRF